MQGQLTFDPGTNTVRIYLVCRASANIAASQAIGIIPEPYRPKTQKFVFCYEKMNNNAAQIAYPGVVETNGNVRHGGRRIFARLNQPSHVYGIWNIKP